MNKTALWRQKFDMKQNNILFLLSSFIETHFAYSLLSVMSSVDKRSLIKFPIQIYFSEYIDPRQTPRY